MDWSAKERALLCPDCLKQIPFIDRQGCRYCGKSLENETACSCRLCDQKIYYSTAYSACEYEGIIRKNLLDFKFSGKNELSNIFAWLIIRKLQMTNEKKFDIIINVPMHDISLRKRGYNQSELIAKNIARFYSKPLVRNGLIKTKATLTQSKLDKKDRIKNIKDAFKIGSKSIIKNQRILLVDDILTTGATVNECSKVLIEGGAKEIIIATIATGKIKFEEPSKGEREYGN